MRQVIHFVGVQRFGEAQDKIRAERLNLNATYGQDFLNLLAVLQRQDVILWPYVLFGQRPSLRQGSQPKTTLPKTSQGGQRLSGV